METLHAEKELSLLYQLISLGLYESAYSLSLILGRVIKIRPPIFESLNPAQVKQLFMNDHDGNDIVSLYFNENYNPAEAHASSLFPGQILFSMTSHHTRALACMYGGTDDLTDDIVISGISEIGNILCAGILNAIADKLHTTLSPSLPSTYQNFDGERLSEIIQSRTFFDCMENNSIIIRSSFVDKNKNLIEINIFILFFENTFENLIAAVGKSHDERI